MDNGCLRYSRFSPDIYFEGVSLLVITKLSLCLRLTQKMHH